VAFVPDGTLTYTETTLTNDSVYIYRLCVQDTVGNNVDQGTALNCTPTASNTPPVFGGSFTGADSGSDGAVTFTWAEASDVQTAAAALEYEVCRSTATGDCGVSFTVDYTTTGAASCGGGTCTLSVNTGLTNGTKYFFWVRAKDGGALTTANPSEVIIVPTFRTLQINGGFNMISVPGELGAGVSNLTLFDDDLDSSVTTMGWNGGYFIASTIEEGTGYFLLKRSTETNDVIDIDSVPYSSGDCGDYSCYTAQASSPVSVSVNTGWNLIGNPCLTNVSGIDIKVILDIGDPACDTPIPDTECTFAQAVTGGFVKNTIYRSNGVNYSDAPTVSVGENVEPWKGYWFYVFSGSPVATQIQTTCGTQ
jgi:hypothetical protein